MGGSRGMLSSMALGSDFASSGALPGPDIIGMTSDALSLNSWAGYAGPSIQQSCSDLPQNCSKSVPLCCCQYARVRSYPVASAWPEISAAPSIGLLTL